MKNDHNNKKRISLILGVLFGGSLFKTWADRIGQGSSLLFYFFIIAIVYSIINNTVYITNLQNKVIENKYILTGIITQSVQFIIASIIIGFNVMYMGESVYYLIYGIIFVLLTLTGSIWILVKNSKASLIWI